MSEPTTEAAGSAAEHAKPFVWFDDTEGTLTELARQIQVSGPGVHLEIHERHGGTWLHVIPALAKAMTFEPLNKSHPCPPDCP